MAGAARGAVERSSEQSCWVLAEAGKTGTEVPCLALAEALGLAPGVKRLALPVPWAQLAPHLRWGLPAAARTEGGGRLAPPWPEVVISCGRRSAAVAAAVRQASRGASFAVHLQNPGLAAARFDLVVAAAHDGLAGDNVLTVRGSLHGLRPARLAAARAAAPAEIGRLPRPRVAVLLGGRNRAYRLTRRRARALGRDLAGLARREGAGLMVTGSRRTGRANMAELRAALAEVPAVVWDGAGDNPYAAFLAAADHLVVTCDSVNMVTEAAATGRPVHVVDLPGGNAKFRAFHAAMRAAGITRPFRGRLEDWTYPPLDDTPWVAEAVRRRLAEREPPA